MKRTEIAHTRGCIDLEGVGIMMHLMQVHKKLLKEDLEGKSEILIEIRKGLCEKIELSKRELKKGERRHKE